MLVLGFYSSSQRLVKSSSWMGCYWYYNHPPQGTTSNYAGRKIFSISSGNRKIVEETPPSESLAQFAAR